MRLFWPACNRSTECIERERPHFKIAEEPRAGSEQPGSTTPWRRQDELTRHSSFFMVHRQNHSPAWPRPQLWPSHLSSACQPSPSVTELLSRMEQPVPSWSPGVTAQIRNGVPGTQPNNGVICLVQSHSGYLFVCLFLDNGWIQVQYNHSIKTRLFFEVMNYILQFLTYGKLAL